MTPGTRSRFLPRLLRRVGIVLTVVGAIVILGPIALIEATLRWVEREFEVDLKQEWNAR